MTALTHALTEAEKRLACYWPLPAFIASNPLWDMTEQSFLAVTQALYPLSLAMPLDFYRQHYQKGLITPKHLQQAIDQILPSLEKNQQIYWHEQALNFSAEHLPASASNILWSAQLGEYQYQNALEWVKSHCLQWLIQFFSENMTTQSDPSCTHLLNFWHALALRENPQLREIFSSHEIDFHQQLQRLLKELAIPEHLYLDYFTHIIWQLYGWGSFIKWLNTHPDNPWLSANANIEMLLIMWLSYEWLLKQRSHYIYQAPKASFSSAKQSSINTFCTLQCIWQTAFELPYQNKIIEHLQQSKAHILKRNSRPKAQAIFCIDTRSEGIRRHLEETGDYQTFGFAGFFGFAFKLEHACGQQSLQCPALINPNIILKLQTQQASFGLATRKQFLNAYSQTKQSLLSPYALFEMLGIWALFKLIAKTFIPSKTLKWSDQLLNNPELSNHSLNFDQNLGFSREEAVENAFFFLTAIGLTDNFAPTVLICAHQSTSTNNPFAATLDCGACGGNSGIPNAWIAAQVLNDENVRKALNQKGICIPQSTRFLPACHHTTRDEIEVFTPLADESIQLDLEKAALRLREEKQKSLPTKRSIKGRESDWSELIPELGLINNRAIIIAPRSLTIGMDLERQTFLHDYDPSLDHDGKILTTILTAPVVVAHWINAQYYFSTVNPNQFGAGNKAIHNVIPGIGVMSGNLSDLKIGLPEQSIQFQGELMHEPRRLLVVVYAKRKQVEAILQEQPQLASLISGHWIRLEVIEP